MARAKLHRQLVTADREHSVDRDASAARRGGSVEAGHGESEWARMALSLQRSAGNRAVSALVQRKNGKKGGGTKAEKEAADKARRKAQQQQKDASAGAAMKEKLAAGKEKREAGAAQAAKNEEKARQKAAKVSEIAASWRVQIGAAVDQVKALRHQKRTEGWSETRVMGINAGTNSGAPTIPGGTNNPITFTVPPNDLGIGKADVSAAIAQFDSSDSGLFKFRMADRIFIHGQ